MTDTQKSFSDYEALLAQKERELLMQRNRVWAFLDTDHKSKTTKEYQAEVRKSGLEISDILFSLMELEESSGFKDAAKSLCERCKSLDIYIRDMHQGLADDFAEKHKIEESRKIDLVKNVGFLLAVPFGFAASVKNGVTHGRVDVDTAAEAGIIISTAVVFHKSIGKAFKQLGESICNTSYRIRNSFALYYFRETFRQNALAGISGFREGTEILSREISATPSRAGKAIRHLVGRDKPKV